ncbi:CxxxxCH/CxxCH domain-containing protein [Geoalkalibacter halelectricus]|uniref:CxxxxCH/CxxCH domain-containing protein n=1 Tax=Geoalkalibacter halelectricus TaxID=2847045 RepID=A0ABY5ZPP6_9BACT|nr:CxxxxCH/CxxCH domain-containing protein [Geoalkalibacter halelectricus]UWZ79927.1 CxxxxCH/CxxCH domain-containing protein [Geoalkalibacter halelectricus]
MSFTDLGQTHTNICLQCHKDNPTSWTMLDGSSRIPIGLFAPGDASNALGSYPEGKVPGSQTSHMWAAPDVNSAAGAQAPSDRRFYGRYHISTGKVTCQRCHDPHSRDPDNTKMLRLGAGSVEQMCVECHVPWVVGTPDRGLLSHPIVPDYAAAVAEKQDRFRLAEDIAAAPGDVQLVDGGVACTSCHGVHFADSRSATPLEPGAAGYGDGKLLRSDGLLAEDASILCQACHTYKAHGSPNEEVGCLVCHSGHSYNHGEVNYFVLRNQAQTATFGAVGGLRYTALPDVHGGSSTVAAQWAGMPGAADGFCERCHGELTTMPNSSRAHMEGENCLDCHSHNAPDMTYSFGANCTDCHGFPPAGNVAGGPDGYAYVEGGHDYAADPYYKNEALAPHTSHAGAGSGYAFACNLCHNADDFAATHNQGSFQDVFLAGNSFASLVTAGGILSPSYDSSGAGTCSNLYCHSSGGKHNPAGKTASDFTTVNVSWGGGKGTITTCTACHGNDAASMDGRNSSAHLKHLAAGYACNVCHVETAASATTLVAGARGGTHVNGVVDVVFDSGYDLGNALLGAATYNSVDGSCAVFCHSDGQGEFASPRWGDPAGGACGSCHATDAQSLGGSHGVHVDPLGANIGCAACHGSGADTGAHAGHVDGDLTVLDNACNSCHGVESEEIILVWGNAESADCLTCHTGAQTTVYVDRDGVERSAAAKSAYFSAGHGAAAFDQACADCHSFDFDPAHMGAGSTARLRTLDGKDYDSDPSGFCGVCHNFAAQVHYATGGASHDASNCIACHDPHGQSGAQDAMIRDLIGTRQVVGFTDRAARSSYYLDLPNQDGNNQYGICQVCHESDAVNYFNRSAAAPAHFAGLCISCHMHDGDQIAFTPTGCNGCHGGGNNDPPADNFWPDGELRDGYSIADRGGAHFVHVDAIGQALSGLDDAAWSAYGGKLAYQNATCSHCHPDPGGRNAEGGPHTEPVTGRSDLVADVHGDVWNDTQFTDLFGNVDVTGFYNPVIQRCSNIACHSNGDYTWTWYEDTIAPGKIEDLAAHTGTLVGTVKLSWTPPDNDGDLPPDYQGPKGPGVYGYEVRYRTGGPVTDANWSSSTIAAGPPSAIRNYEDDPRTQTMTVHGLTPGVSYFFGVKAFDETMINHSPVSNSHSAQALVDSFAPRFQGLESARPAYISGAVDLQWSPARDDTEPLTYLVYWALSSQTIDWDNPQATTTATSYHVTGLQNGLDYLFAVRARDASPAQNVDANEVIRIAIPQAPSENDIFGRMYYMIANSGTNLGGGTTNLNLSCDSSLSFSSHIISLMQSGGYNCRDRDRNRIRDIKSSGNIVTWVLDEPYTEATNIHGGSITLYMRNREDSNTNTVYFDLGYWDNGFVQQDTYTRVLPRRHRGSVKAYFPSEEGKVFTVPEGKRLALRIRKANTREAEIWFGSKRGTSMLIVYEQEQNLLPNPFTVQTPASPASGALPITWSAAVDPEGDEVRYDVYGSVDGGQSWPYIIALGVSGTSAVWNTHKDGLALEGPLNNVRVRVGAGDGLMHRILNTDPGGLEIGSFHDRRYAETATFSVDNSVDTTPPAAITDLVAEHRPKFGTVWLYWHAPGNDGLEGGPAHRYDIRYRESAPYNPADAIDSEAKWAAATQVVGAPPLPAQPGRSQGFEVLGLNPGKDYFFSVRSVDEAGNWSALSNSPSSKGGLRCGVCHGNPPDDFATMGSHAMHGYTQVDCAKCHGEGAIHYDLKHNEGNIKLAWNNPRQGFVNEASTHTTLSANLVEYHDEGVLIYRDATGPGGFNDLSIEMKNVDSGTCSGFNATGVTGCHGSGSPVWGARDSVSCALCHGDPERSDKDLYGRAWEDQTTDTRYGGNKPIYKAAPPISIFGNSNDFAVGQHLRHLNFSYRFTGDQCSLCHYNADHADGTVDVRLHPAAGSQAEWVPPQGGNPGSCMGTSQMRCHGDNAEPPQWVPRSPEPDGPKLVNCNECHGHVANVFWPGATLEQAVAGRSSTVSGNQGGDGVTTTLSVSSTGNNLQVGDRFRKGETFFQVVAKAGTTLSLHQAIPTGMAFANNEVLRTEHIPHTSDGGIVRDCTWCHVEGHPQGDETAEGRNPPGEETVFIPNFPMVGIDYSSGGIHLRKEIGGRGPFHTEAEICWGCHDAQTPRISEWGYSGLPHDRKNEGAITNVSQGTTTTITSSGHGLQTGDRVVIFMPNGVTVLNGWAGTITRTGVNTFTLDETSTGSIDSNSQSGNFSSTGARWKLASSYDYGLLHDGSGSWGSRTPSSNWVTGTWDSPYFPYKTGAVQSTHSVNPDVTRPGVDAVGQIRCSYCHDVHDLNLAPGDVYSGRPYLRGSWKGNPYFEDGAPGRFAGFLELSTDRRKAEYYYTGERMDYGMVPRGSIEMNKMGGYWIDQNSDYPTVSWSLQDSAGLCTLCHGTDVNNMNKFDVNADGSPENSWVGDNGHSNAVIGGSGVNRFNVYSPSVRQEGNISRKPGIGYQDTDGMKSGSDIIRFYGLRNNDGSSRFIDDNHRTQQGGRGVYPYAWSTTERENRYAYEEFTWGVSLEAEVAEPMYHRFSCSKCHNPHASRLPRLMVTNCLDVSHNKWDDLFAGDPDWDEGRDNVSDPVRWSGVGSGTRAEVMPYTGNDVSGKPRNKQFAYATSAQNCHRFVKVDGVVEEPGWNRITPWEETSSWYNNH